MTIDVQVGGVQIPIRRAVFTTLLDNSVAGTYVDYDKALASGAIKFPALIRLAKIGEIPYPLFFADLPFVEAQVAAKTEKLLAGVSKETFQVVAERIRHNLPGAVVKELDALILRPALATTNVARDRQMLADVKMRLGEAEMRKLMAGDLALSNPTSVLAAAPKKWSISTTEIRSSRGTAQDFAAWFDTRRTKNDTRAMLVACPDHYVMKTVAGAKHGSERRSGIVLTSRCADRHHEHLHAARHRRGTREPCTAFAGKAARAGLTLCSRPAALVYL